MFQKQQKLRHEKCIEKQNDYVEKFPIKLYISKYLICFLKYTLIYYYVSII